MHWQQCYEVLDSCSSEPARHSISGRCACCAHQECQSWNLAAKGAMQTEAAHDLALDSTSQAQAKPQSKTIGDASVRVLNADLALHAGSSSGRCLYVSGVPGTGKTATVMETIRRLRRKSEAGQLPAFQFADINSLRLPSPQHAYTQLYEVCIHQITPCLSAHLFIAFCKGCTYAWSSSRENELQFCLTYFPF
jgi:Cdc6-like AAA superfamily ATPase